MLGAKDKYLAYEFSELQIPEANEWTQNEFIETMEPHYITYISALAGILAVKYLLRI